MLLLLLPLVCLALEPAPPPHKDLVGNARWMVKYSNVSVVATHSHFLDGFPFAQSKDVADGLYNQTFGTGVPYIYNSPMSTLEHDFTANPKVTFAYSAEFTHYCQDSGIDNDDPRCGKVMLSGEICKVTDVDEQAWARTNMFVRHPATSAWPPGHGFAFFKLNIQNIFTLDYFGGATKHLDITQYLNYKPNWDF